MKLLFASTHAIEISSQKHVEIPSGKNAYASTEAAIETFADGHTLKARGILHVGLNVLTVEIVDVGTDFKAGSQGEFSPSIIGMSLEARLTVPTGWSSPARSTRTPAPEQI